MTGPYGQHPPGQGPYGPGPYGQRPYGPGEPYPQYIPPGYVHPGQAHQGQGPPEFSPPGSGYRATARFSQGRHRPHWATAVLRGLTILIVYLLFVVTLVISEGTSDPKFAITSTELRWFFVVTGLVVLAGAGGGIWVWAVTRFWISENDVMVETGLWRRRTRRIPLSRVQAVDLVRPLVTRGLGLAEVRIELAGGDEAEIALRYLGRAAAQDLRAELLARAAGLPGYTPEAPERLFWRVKQGTLFASLTLKLPVLGASVLFVVLVSIGIIYAELGVLGAAVPILLGLLRAVAAPLIVYGGFSISASPDGLRLRSGLLETRMQTVPPGRVQAVRVIEPLLWRPYGWARVDVTVAGYVGERQVMSSVLLPIGPREVAMRLVAEIFPGTDVEAVPLSPSSAKAFWGKAAAGSNDVVFVARRGMVCERLDIIPHARAQSVHIVSGPLQWLLGIGTVHIDAPPGPVEVAAVNRELGEARAIAEATAERARRARAADKGPGRWVQ
ncbi:MAG TPA: PH domain-containing protein [Streptosporangiaceae bacterium]|jgi:putative membrane protein